MGHFDGLDPDILPDVCQDLVGRDETAQSGLDGDLPSDQAPAESRQSSQLSPEFDLRLAVLAAIRDPNETLSTEDIAAFCGCCRQTIVNIEERALKKLRKALRKAGVRPEDIHFTDHRFAQRADRMTHD